MKAIVQQRYGSPDRLVLTEVDQPVPSPGEVLVRVEAAAVNAKDWHVMRGDPYVARLMLPAAFGMSGPKRKIRGSDFAGVVAAVGSEVKHLQVGAEVYGELGFADGAFAEYACVPQDTVELKPRNLTFEQAASMPLAANTALMGLRDLAQVRAGQSVLINGASGGVGTFAVQLAKAFGAEVTAVCSTRNVGLVESIGADRVIDYSKVDFTRGPQRYDVVFDLVANRSLAELRRVLTPRGTLVLSGGGVSGGGSLFGPVALLIAGQVRAKFVKQRLLSLTAVPSRANLATLRELAETGKIVPVIDRVYPLAQTAEAIRYLETEHARAKVVIAV